MQSKNLIMFLVHYIDFNLSPTILNFAIFISVLHRAAEFVKEH
jgi:hypothetical protein